MNQTFGARWKKVSLPNKLTVACTAIIAVATVCYVIASFRQLEKMAETLAEMRASREGSTGQTDQVIGNMNWLARTMDGALQQNRVAMERSEKQSKAALDASIAIANNEQRAWLTVPSKYDLVDFMVNGPVTYTMGFVNTGRTPARGINAIVRMQIVATGTEPDFAYPAGTSNEYAVGELVPNDEEPRQLQARDSHAPIILTSQQVDRIRSGLDYAVIFGEVTYRDIAGPHWMRFCRGVYKGPLEKEQTPQKCAQYNSSGDGKTPPKFE